ncbi:hypothetical protein IMSHALPRED_003206 [Imshaugia aleurites]|uniref:Rhodopsin domain-containing protein n=1 Tax=Imshaugia aleurites TaxID=172621 RepID=A0A8H3J788_9LECA|nr:hypothetical protein IMSHALPRED_003206 [Imshaugia aleurites]
MSFELPSNRLSQADLNASNKDSIYAAVAVGFTLATGGVILRVLARRKSEATFGWDDYTIGFALVFSYALDVDTLLSALKYGLGQHLEAVLPAIVLFQKLSLLNIALWLATAAATKASLLLLYYRLFSPNKRFRLAVRIAAAVVFCQWFSLTAATIFQCVPVAAFWNHYIQGAKCINLPRFTVVSGVLNLLTDVMILCLPIPMVWGLNTTKTQKVTLTGIFLLGIFVCIISIVRISKIAAVNYDDPTWRLVDVYVWTALENSVGILSACLPTMRPLVGRFVSGGAKSGSSNKKDGRSSPQHMAKGQFNRLFEESELNVEPRRHPELEEGAWTSPDLATSNELFSMDRAPTRPQHSTNSTNRRGDLEYPANSTRRANYE